MFLVLPSQQGLPQEAAISAGHSYHGEAFNEGPRTAAYLMPGMDRVHFPATTSKRLVQQFIDQGVAQLHGFWYYEAERSFRQAAQLDPDCAIAYWGMALANTENPKRARGFIAEAIQRQKSASRREQMYIEAFHQWCQEPDEPKKDEKPKKDEEPKKDDEPKGDDKLKGDDKPKKDEELKKDIQPKKDDGAKKDEERARAKAYTQALEQIVLDFPEDIEAKAFLAGQLWHNSRSDLPLVSHVAVNSLLQEILDMEPLHPAHHYRIHLWDNHQPQQALASSALCGPSLPAVAHMWHMPGHIYSRLHRYHDACWQQEASARVDHAHMIRDRLLPDQIHNFAHNNEWLIRNLLCIGRLSEAIDLSKNMIELPRHPKFNTLKTKGSAKYGRQRLLQTLSTYQLWEELVELSKTSYLSPYPDEEELHLEWSRHVGTALALSGSSSTAESIITDLNQRLAEAKTALAELPAATEQKPLDSPAQEPKQLARKRKQPKKQKSRERKKQAEQQAQSASNGQDSPAESVDAQATGSQEQPVAPESSPPDRKKLEERQTRIEKVLAAVQAAQRAADAQWAEAVKLAEQGEVAPLLKIQWQAQASLSESQADANAGPLEKNLNPSASSDTENSDTENSDSEEKCSAELKTAQELVKSQPGEILPLALLAWLQHEQSGAEAAKETFEQLRVLASAAELETPLLQRLAGLAKELGLPSDWQLPYEPASDIGLRPDLDSLGPFRWQPFPMPNFTISDRDGHSTDANLVINKPTVVIFYLGFGCLHCIEQLQAFSPQVQKLREAGIEVIAVSTESLEQLHDGLQNFHEPLEIPLHVDPTLAAFKAMRCFDDFENQPLHGTFMVVPAPTDEDPRALRVLWQDISYEPFMDVEFVRDEFQRLARIHESLTEVTN